MAKLGSERVAEVPFGGEEVSRSVLEGLPLVMSHANNPTARAILEVARELEQSGREAVALSAR
jgi:MinD-like ATPase involved in chromosome partitioning or flagellar assembly